jgi:sporulation protein YlmC with PRC-barrel domain
MTTAIDPATGEPAPESGARIIRSTETSDGPGPNVIAAHTLTGYAVVSPTGEKLGDVEAIMLDIGNGRIAYAVLSFGGFLGIGDKLFAIPWAALTLDTRAGNFILNVSKEKLARAPGFDKDHWPSMADSAWAGEVHGFYEVVPYWRVTERSSQLRF